MTHQLDEAIEKIRQLPRDEQDYIADILLDYADQDGSLHLSDEQAQEVCRRLIDPNPRFATLEDVLHRFVRREA